MTIKAWHTFSIITLVVSISLLIFFIIAAVLNDDTVFEIGGAFLGWTIGASFLWWKSISHIKEERSWKKIPNLTANVEITNITSVVGGTSLSVSTSFHVRFDFLDLHVHQVFPLDANEKGGMIEGEQGVLTYKHLTTKKGDFVRFISFQPK